MITVFHCAVTTFAYLNPGQRNKAPIHVSGHPQEAEKVSATGTLRLYM